MVPVRKVARSFAARCFFLYAEARPLLRTVRRSAIVHTNAISRNGLLGVAGRSRMSENRSNVMVTGCIGGKDQLRPEKPNVELPFDDPFLQLESTAHQEQQASRDDP